MICMFLLVPGQQVNQGLFEQMRPANSDTNTILIITPWVLFAILLGYHYFTVSSQPTRNSFAVIPPKNDSAFIQSFEKRLADVVKNSKNPSPIIDTSALQKQIQDLNEAVNNLTKDRDSLNDNNTNLQATIVSLNEEITILRNINTILISNLTTAKDNYKDLKVEFDKQTELLDSYKKKVPVQSTCEGVKKQYQDFKKIFQTEKLLLKTEVENAKESLTTWKKNASDGISASISQIDSVINSQSNPNIDWSPIKKALGEIRDDLTQSKSPTFSCSKYISKIFQASNQVCSQESQKHISEIEKLTKQRKQFGAYFNQLLADLKQCDDQRKKKKR